MQKTTICTSSENLTKSTEIAAFWQGSFYSCPVWVAKCDRIWYNITIKIKKAVEKPNGKEAGTRFCLARSGKQKHVLFIY